MNESRHEFVNGMRDLPPGYEGVLLKEDFENLCNFAKTVNYQIGKNVIDFILET